MPAKRVIPFGVTFFIHKITKYFKQPGYQQRFSAKIFVGSANNICICIEKFKLQPVAVVKIKILYFVGITCAKNIYCIYLMSVYITRNLSNID